MRMMNWMMIVATLLICAAPKALAQTKPTVCTDIESCTRLCAQYNEADWSETAAVSRDMLQIPDTQGIKANSKMGSVATLAALKKAGELAAAQGLTISVRDAFRPRLTSIRMVCGAINNGSGDHLGKSVPLLTQKPLCHESGRAVDVALMRGNIMLSAPTSRFGRQPREADRILKEIMFAAGFTNHYDLWHFEIPAIQEGTDIK